MYFWVEPPDCNIYSSGFTTRAHAELFIQSSEFSTHLELATPKLLCLKFVMACTGVWEEENFVRLFTTVDPLKLLDR